MSHVKGHVSVHELMSFGSSIYLFFPPESQRAEMEGARAGSSLLDNRKYSSVGEEEGEEEERTVPQCHT